MHGSLFKLDMQFHAGALLPMPPARETGDADFCALRFASEEESLALTEKPELAVRRGFADCIEDLLRIAVMQWEGPEMAGNADSAAQSACVIRRLCAVKIAVCTVDRQNRNFRLDFHRNGQAFPRRSGIASVINTGEAEIENEA